MTGYSSIARGGRGARVLQWRSPGLDVAGIECLRHRELLELETVQSTSLESFKRAIVEALAPPPVTPPPLPNGGRPFVFLNTEPRHDTIGAQIRAGIGDRAAWAEPLRVGSALEVRRDLEQNLIDCDAMVMIYADNAGWARAVARLCQADAAPQVSGACDSGDRCTGRAEARTRRLCAGGSPH